jgi:hypothetical protein
MEELLTITVKTFFWFVDIGGIVDHRSSLLKVSFGLLILEEL